MPGPRCRSCCRSRWASPCLRGRRGRLMTSRENMSHGACVRRRKGSVVMSLNPATLQLLSALPGRRAHCRRARGGGACPGRGSPACGRSSDRCAVWVRRCGRCPRPRWRRPTSRAWRTGCWPGCRGGPGLLDRVREAWRRPWFPVGGLVAVAAAAFFAFAALRPRCRSAGRRGAVGHRRCAGPAAPGGAQDRERRRHHLAGREARTPRATTGATVLPPDKPGAQAPVPAQQRPRAGEL